MPVVQQVLAIAKVSRKYLRVQRLLCAKDFERVFKSSPRRQGDDLFTLLILRNEVGHARLGVIVSRRVMPLAVGRNQIKRQVRESFRLEAMGLPAVDVVVIARPGVGNKSKEAPPVNGLDMGVLRNKLAKQWALLRRWNASSSV